MKTLTVKELGQKLPIGIISGNSLIKEFTLRPYKAKTDRYLNIWLEANPEAKNPHLVAKLMSLQLESAGGIQFPEPKAAEAASLLVDLQTKWFLADVMYVYFWSRIKAVGSKVDVPYVCPMQNAEGSSKCSARGMTAIDLMNAEVNVIENIKELDINLKLKDGLQLRSGDSCRSLTMQPARFRVMMSEGSTVQGASSTGYSHLRDSVTSVDTVSGPYTLTEGEIDELSKVDLLKIDRETISAGLDLKTSYECPKCGAPIVDWIDWTYDSFFGSSVPLAVTMD